MYNNHTALTELIKSGFTCEAGPIALSEAFKHLTKEVKPAYSLYPDGLLTKPKYSIGDVFYIKLEAEVEGHKLSNKFRYVVMAVEKGEDNYFYKLTTRLPQRYWSAKSVLVRTEEELSGTRDEG